MAEQTTPHVSLHPHYYSLPDIDDVAWSHERPIDEMQAIDSWLAFDAGKVREQVE